MTKRKKKKLDKKEILKRLNTEYDQILDEYSLTDICNLQYVNKKEVLKRLRTEYYRILDGQNSTDTCNPCSAELDELLDDIAIVLRMLAIKYDVNDIDIDRVIDIKMERERLRKYNPRRNHSI